MTFTTQVIGIDEITTNPSVRFISTTTDGNSIFVGSESTSGAPDVWQYLNNSWKRITSDLAEEPNIRSVNSLLYFNKNIFAGTSKGLYDFAGLDSGQVWKTAPGGWEDTSLSFPGPYNVCIRKLVKLKDEIFAGGSVFYIYKYKNNTWSQVLNLGVLASNVADMTTDGLSKVYITTNGLDTNCYSGVIQYEDGVLTEISEPLFDDSNNSLISKLCWGTDSLFAATFNDKTGTQIWEYKNSNWTCLITDGFGSKNNYNVIDMKFINNYLVVSTENIDGGKIFYYDPIDPAGKGFLEIFPKSKFNYLNFLLEYVQGKLFLIGRELKLFDVDGTTDVYLRKQDRLINEAFYWPNGAIGAEPIGIEGGRYRFFAGNGAYTMISEGTIQNPLEDVSMSPRVSGTPEFKSQVPEQIIYPSSLDYSINSSKIVIPKNAQPGVFIERFNFNVDETDQYAAFSSFTPKLITTDREKYAQAFPMSPPLPEEFIGNYFGKLNTFNSIHMALIPKGKHRGKVFMMSGYPVIGYVSSIHPTEAWSFQPWSIFDPSPDAGTPGKPKFLNYMLPIGPSANFNEYLAVGTPFQGLYPNATDDFVWPNLFCAGHAWSPSGDLIVGGGSLWGFEYSPGGVSWADGKCFVWNPETVSGSFYGWSGTSPAGTIVSSFTNQQHYSGAGAWTRAQDLSIDRWYPTVMIYPKVARTSNHPHALMFGGDSTITNYPQTQYDTYEAFVISSICTSSNPGIGFTGVYDGPSDRDVSSRYEFCPPFPGFKSIIWQDSFYFYPRTFILSGGEITFAGMSHISSYLNYDYSPTGWNKSLGGSSLTSDNRFRQYCTSYRVPNVNGNPDILVRAGGADIHSSPIDSCNRNMFTTDTLDGSILTSTWSAGPTLQNETVDANSVILPDATVMIFGGFRYIIENLISRRMSESIPYNSAYHPVSLGDHHSFDSIVQLAQLSSSFTEEDIHFLEHELEHILEGHIDHPHRPKVDLVYIRDETLDSNSSNTDGTFEYHVYPQIIDYKEENPQWKLADWCPLEAWRDYHSAALLLPDGRILIGGGENRHSPFNLINPNGYDFEIFYPKYLRPTQNPADTLLRPTGVGLSGSTYNSNPQVDCNELNYNGQYVVSCTPLRTGISIKKVVLMAPGCVTHHADTTQRYYQCNSTIESTTQLRFSLPANEKMLAPGFYMLFVITNQEVPSKALWVWLR